MARASSRESLTESALDRRSFLVAVAATALWPRRLWAEASAKAALDEAALRALESSPFAYISPLKTDGSESTCHGEVWYGWLDGSVVLNTRRGTWKAKALARGLDRARIWVGDHGRWKARLGDTRSEAFRQAPSFEARARLEKDKAVNDRLIALFETKYAGEFDRWREDMRDGFYSGQRVLIRYEPT